MYMFFFQNRQNFFRDFAFFPKSPRNDVETPWGPPGGHGGTLRVTPAPCLAPKRAVAGVLSIAWTSKIYETVSIFQDEDDGGIIF